MSNRSGATVRRLATALLVAAGLISGTANASPVHYTFNFTLQSGNVLPTSASFDYDASAPAFTNFSVPWNGLTFNLTGSANSPIVIGSVYQTSCGLSGAALTFAFLSHAPCIEFFVSATSDIWFGQIPVSFAQPQIFAFDAI